MLKAAFFAALVASLVLFLVPASGTAPGFPLPHADKLVHAAVFAALGGLAARAWPERGRLMLLVLLALYGGFVELAQGLVPGRAPDAWDWLADALGAAAGILLARPRGARRAHAA